MSRSVGQRDVDPRATRYREAATPARCEHARQSPPRRAGARLRAPVSAWIDKSRADLALLTTELDTGPYPYAGIPWFSTPFGRDAIVTALQTLWLDPALARGVLAFLADHQASETSAFRDAEPGKIMHETRKGEMAGAQRGAVRPLLRRRRHHAAVRDAGGRLRRTHGRHALHRQHLWPALLAAMEWIEGNARRRRWLRDYAARRTDRPGQPGLEGQPRLASSTPTAASPKGPIALVEVQGYAFAACAAMADAVTRRGDEFVRARAWERRGGGDARPRVERASGCRGCRLLRHGPRRRRRAVPGARHPIAGHLLFVGLALARSAARAGRRATAARRPSIAAGACAPCRRTSARYNPMSYHNGSVWPHDTALCAAGMARYGERDGVVRLLGDMFEAAVHFGHAPAGAVLRLRTRARARRRSPTRSPACPRPGRQARCSCCCKPAWV